ncbi:hypothetical protein KI387_031539, partial [Taxus chinensis]
YSLHDEEIEERSFEAFKARVPMDKGVIKCSDSQDDEIIPLDSCLEMQNKDSSKEYKEEIQERMKRNS